MQDINEIRRQFAADRFATDNGCRIVSWEEGRCVIELEVEYRHKNAAGMVQGGVIFTLADFAFSVASNAGGEWTVSLTSTVSFIKGVSSGRLTAVAERISQGRRGCCYEVRVPDDGGDEVARVMVNGYGRGRSIEESGHR